MRHQIKPRLAVAILAIGTLVQGACTTDPNEAANKLFVEAQQSTEKAEKQSKPADKLALFSDAEQRLKTIVSKYPSANLAVQLASGQSVGVISLKAAADNVARTQQAICFDTPTRVCLFDQAIAAAHAGEDDQKFTRAFALSFIALDQARAGLTKASSETFVQAKSAYGDTKKEWRERALSGLAISLAGAGKIDEALNAIQEVSDPRRRFTWLRQLALAQAESGLHKEAAATIAGALGGAPPANDIDRADKLAAAAVIQVLTGASKEAADGIEQALKLAPSWPTTLGMIAQVQARLGQKAPALATLAKAMENAQSPAYRSAKEANISSALGPIFAASSLCALADIKAIVASFENEERRSSILLCGVRGHAEEGNIGEAQGLTQMINESLFRVYALSYVAQAQARARLTSQAMGTIGSALQIVPSLQPSGRRAYALWALARVAPE